MAVNSNPRQLIQWILLLFPQVLDRYLGENEISHVHQFFVYAFQYISCSSYSALIK